MERYESWNYSLSFHAGRLRFHRSHRRWQEGRLHDWQLVYTFIGQGLISCAGKSFFTKIGEVLLFPPQMPRSYEPAGKPVCWEHIWVHFQPDDSFGMVLGRLTQANRMTLLTLPTPELQKKVQRDLSEMCDVGASQAFYREHLALKLLETALIRCLSVAHPNDRQDSLLDPRLKRALDLLSENLTAPFESAALARACGLSQRQMFRLFAEQTSHSPRTYLEHCRIARARHLLKETTLSVSEVGDQVGFENPFYFTTRFKIQTGMSPRAYRREFSAAC